MDLQPGAFGYKRADLPLGVERTQHARVAVPRHCCPRWPATFIAPQTLTGRLLAGASNAALGPEQASAWQAIQRDVGQVGDGRWSAGEHYGWT